MQKILVAVEIKTQEKYNDLIYRLYHHFSFLDNFKIYLLLANGFKPSELVKPSIFGSTTHVRTLNEFIKTIIFRTIRNENDIDAVAENASKILIYSEDYYKRHSARFKLNNPKIYWCDPVRTRQEGSSYIQAALDCMTDVEKQKNERESLEKFIALQKQLKNKYSESVVLATGPSIENFSKYDYSKKLVIACNSTILNGNLTDKTHPKILVFADPIFHFGISQYAEYFRNICKKFLDKNPDVNLIIPIKYYALLKSLLPTNEHQIIGIPFTKHRPINIDINEKHFYTFTTANILTLLLIPLATTFSEKISLIGCDGRSLSDGTYFWNHGKSVQINDKMRNIQECHPGFFNIDYNEYYFEHCHTLDNFISFAELKKKKFVHLGNTHIPALAKRSIDNKQVSAFVNSKNKFPNNIKHLLIEPDGIDESSGHYLNWHLNLAREISNTTPFISILARKDTRYTIDNYELEKIFESRSWEIQRASNAASNPFPFNRQGSIFFAALKNYLSNHFQVYKEPLHIFMYYGSVQAIKFLLELQKIFSDKQIFFTVCIFQESVNLDPNNPKKNFHYETKKILMEAAAKIPYFRLFSVTKKLSDIIYELYEVKTSVMAHPLINVDIVSEVIPEFQNAKANGSKDKIEIYMPARIGYQKNEENIFEVVYNLLAITENIYVKLRNTTQAKAFVSNIDRKDLLSRITILNDLDNSKKYFHELCSSDIIFLPYTPQGFYARTSGILYDSILAKKPIITLNNTWLSENAYKLKVGIYVCKLTSEALNTAIRLISENISYFKQNLSKAATYLKYHESFKTLYFQIVSPNLNQFEYY